MGKRTTARRLAMQALFQSELGKNTIDKSLEYIFENDSFLDETKDFARQLATETYKRKDSLDELITTYLRDWSIDRLSGVDRAILRLTLYEIQLKDNPSNVVINEALNLAKRYSEPNSIKFINGVLGAYLKNVG